LAMTRESCSCAQEQHEVIRVMHAARLFLRYVCTYVHSYATCPCPSEIIDRHNQSTALRFRILLRVNLRTESDPVSSTLSIPCKILAPPSTCISSILKIRARTPVAHQPIYLHLVHTEYPCKREPVTIRHQLDRPSPSVSQRKIDFHGPRAAAGRHPRMHPPPSRDRAP
jgi:hypothetical protein